MSKESPVRKMLAAAVFALVLATGLGAFPSSARAEGVCVVRVHDPHNSENRQERADAVVAKTTVQYCGSSVDEIELTMLLFRCPNEPEEGPELTWYSQGCVEVGANPAVVIVNPGSTLHTRQVSYTPNPTRDTGNWFIACTIYREVAGSAVAGGTVPSNPAFVVTHAWPDIVGTLPLP
jgi:hypothetical protein